MTDPPRKKIIPRLKPRPKRLIPRARNTDAWTSHEAAEPFNEVMKERTLQTGHNHHIVLAAYFYAVDGLAAFQAVEESGYAMAWKRVSELGELGLITCTGVPRYNPHTRRNQLVWTITPKGTRALRRLDAGKNWTDGVN